jgi:hypothetical protein
LEFLREKITEAPLAATLGNVAFMQSGNYSAFANFLDDFSGTSASTNKIFGAMPTLRTSSANLIFSRTTGR